jgi:hypothetical protein
MNIVYKEVTTDIVPTVGMGATLVMWSDRHAYTVVEVLSPKKIVVQQDIAERIDKNGCSENQKYQFNPNPNASKQVFTKRKNGKWIKLGNDMSNSSPLILGWKDEYYDYTF